jgi:hypothetical protein
MGVGLIIIGAYRWGTFEVNDPHTFFLAFYYIFFGSLLILFLVFRSKIYFCFRLLSIPLGKAFLLLFLAAMTLDVTDIGRFIICLLLIIGAILNAVYFLIFYTSEYEEEAKKPQKKPVESGKPLKKENPEPTFGKREIEEPEKILDKSEAKNDSGTLQRRT